MSVKFRDYYEVLGVERSASQDDIRKAFRKLARKYHPDVAEDKTTADEKFKELNEAYEVLSAPEKREKYDKLGPNWEHMSDFQPPPGAGGFGGPGGGGGYEYHFDGTGFSDFFEQLFGRRSGRGGFGGFSDVGAGGASMPPMEMRGRDIEAEILVSLDEIMKGSERVLTLQRAGLPGQTGSADTVRVRIPQGVCEGQLIRCAGLGEPGYNGGENGDLFLRVLIQRHPDFRIEQHDLHHDLHVAPWEAVLGAKVKIPTPHGTLSLKIPPGTSNLTELRLRGKGLPQGTGDKMGDLYAKVLIEVPETVSDEEKALWEKLRNLSTFDPRQP
ncbi:J domain-containing protein [bacterium]|jgi:curved DNA-binding protein|nr:J domain-containing protein [bacterium]MDF1787906.1 J domain-containing protein [Verrucomicrobiales bacterium]